VYTHILISTDGSELAQNGVDHGLSLAKALGSKVTIVTVTEVMPISSVATAAGWVATPVDFENYDASQKEFASNILSTAKASAEKMGIDVNTVHVPDALPASAIVDSAQKYGCNLIVMASHGRRGIKRLLLGSQTSEVLSTATIPVLVVR
jgi:nucleotide-binding universal stress UspA family protein